MKITFLGTGTSQGVPVIGCDCHVCTSLDFRDKRYRTSVHVQIEEKSFVIDCGPDFRNQMLQNNIQRLDAIIFTHEHKDHTAGLDDVRAFNFKQLMDMPLYGHSRVLNQLKSEFAYAFSEINYPGVPRFELHTIENTPFVVKGVKWNPIEVFHYKLPVFGYRIKDFTYITDTNHIPPMEMEKAKNSKVLVLDALQREKHISHFNLEQALEVIEELQPEKAFLVHISHKMGKYSEIEAILPENVALAFDGLVVNL